MLRSLAPSERRALAAVTAERLARPGRRDWRPLLRGAQHVVFVCHGNIIRSPLAAVALEREATQRHLRIQITSAGLAARAGEAADSRAVTSAEHHGYSLAAHRSRLLDQEQVESANVIFVMDLINLGRLLARFPAARARVFLLGGSRPDGTTSLAEIHDPVSGTLDDVAHAHVEVLNAVHRVAGAWDQERQ